MARQYRKRPWKEELKDFFAMHKGERRAFTVLMGLCLAAAAWVTWEQWIRPPLLADSETINVVWRSMQDTTDQRPPPAERTLEDLHLFNFDPNKLPVEQWVLLGLTERQAASIHRYEARGGRFHTKADLARMRVVDPDLFAQWEPYIQLPEMLPRDDRPARAARGPWPEDSARARSGHYAAKAHAGPLELNAADSAALVAVQGIGPAFARSILRYRERLGGFTSLDQLAEVPILRDKPDAVQTLKAKLRVDGSLVRIIPLNSCTADDLGRHPYMGWKAAKALMAYRQQHGPFKQVDDIRGCVLVTDSMRLRMGPYLTVGGPATEDER